MEIIIDGYNLIGSDQGLRGNLEHKRSWVIRQLALYQQIKGYRVTVVFDGWRAGSLDQSEQQAGGVSVVYSRQGEKADAVIVRIARQKGSGCVVVTSDREIRNAVEKFGATAIYAGEFSSILRNIENPLNYEKDSEEDWLNETLAKKGNPRQLSKTERRRREKLKKLRP